MISATDNQTKIAIVMNSKNRKCDGLPVTTSTENTCPWNCQNILDCYAKGGKTAMHWQALHDGKRIAHSVMELCGIVRLFDNGQMWRHNEAGDLDGDRYQIDRNSLFSIVLANMGKRGFTYTHYSPYLPGNAAAIAFANDNGFTVNMSADSLEQADSYADMAIGPVCVVIPENAEKVSFTPAGRKVVKCWNAQDHEITCAKCKWCAMPDRKFIVGFPAHGFAKKRLSKRCNGCKGCK